MDWNAIEKLADFETQRKPPREHVFSFSKSNNNNLNNSKMNSSFNSSSIPSSPRELSSNKYGGDTPDRSKWTNFDLSSSAKYKQTPQSLLNKPSFSSYENAPSNSYSDMGLPNQSPSRLSSYDQPIDSNPSKNLFITQSQFTDLLSQVNDMKAIMNNSSLKINELEDYKRVTNDKLKDYDQIMNTMRISLQQNQLLTNKLQSAEEQLVILQKQYDLMHRDYDNLQRQSMAHHEQLEHFSPEHYLTKATFIQDLQLWQYKQQQSQQLYEETMELKIRQLINDGVDRRFTSSQSIETMNQQLHDQQTLLYTLISSLFHLASSVEGQSPDKRPPSFASISSMSSLSVNQMQNLLHQNLSHSIQALIEQGIVSYQSKTTSSVQTLIEDFKQQHLLLFQPYTDKIQQLYQITNELQEQSTLTRTSLANSLSLSEQLTNQHVQLSQQTTSQYDELAKRLSLQQEAIKTQQEIIHSFTDNQQEKYEHVQEMIQRTKDELNQQIQQKDQQQTLQTQQLQQAMTIQIQEYKQINEYYYQNQIKQMIEDRLAQFALTIESNQQTAWQTYINNKYEQLLQIIFEKAQLSEQKYIQLAHFQEHFLEQTQIMHLVQQEIQSHLLTYEEKFKTRIFQPTLDSLQIETKRYIHEIQTQTKEEIHKEMQEMIESIHQDRLKSEEYSKHVMIEHVEQTNKLLHQDFTQQLLSFQMQYITPLQTNLQLLYQRFINQKTLLLQEYGKKWSQFQTNQQKQLMLFQFSLKKEMKLSFEKYHEDLLDHEKKLLEATLLTQMLQEQVQEQCVEPISRLEQQFEEFQSLETNHFTQTQSQITSLNTQITQLIDETIPSYEVKWKNEMKQEEIEPLQQLVQEQNISLIQELLQCSQTLTTQQTTIESVEQKQAYLILQSDIKYKQIEEHCLNTMTKSYHSVMNQVNDVVYDMKLLSNRIEIIEHCYQISAVTLPNNSNGSNSNDPISLANFVGVHPAAVPMPPTMNSITPRNTFLGTIVPPTIQTNLPVPPYNSSDGNNSILNSSSLILEDKFNQRMDKEILSLRSLFDSKLTNIEERLDQIDQKHIDSIATIKEHEQSQQLFSQTFQQCQDFFEELKQQEADKAKAKEKDVVQIALTNLESSLKQCKQDINLIQTENKENKVKVNVFEEDSLKDRQQLEEIKAKLNVNDSLFLTVKQQFDALERSHQSDQTAWTSATRNIQESLLQTKRDWQRQLDEKTQSLCSLDSFEHYRSQIQEKDRMFEDWKKNTLPLLVQKEATNISDEITRLKKSLENSKEEMKVLHDIVMELSEEKENEEEKQSSTSIQEINMNQYQKDILDIVIHCDNWKQLSEDIEQVKLLAAEAKEMKSSQEKETLTDNKEWIHWTETFQQSWKEDKDSLFKLISDIQSQALPNADSKETPPSSNNNNLDTSTLVTVTIFEESQAKLIASDVKLTKEIAELKANIEDYLTMMKNNRKSVKDDFNQITSTIDLLSKDMKDLQENNKQNTNQETSFKQDFEKVNDALINIQTQIEALEKSKSESNFTPEHIDTLVTQSIKSYLTSDIPIVINEFIATMLQTKYHITIDDVNKLKSNVNDINQRIQMLLKTFAGTSTSMNKPRNIEDSFESESESDRIDETEDSFEKSMNKEDEEEKHMKAKRQESKAIALNQHSNSFHSNSFHTLPKSSNQEEDEDEDHHDIEKAFEKISASRLGNNNALAYDEEIIPGEEEFVSDDEDDEEINKVTKSLDDSFASSESSPVKPPLYPPPSSSSKSSLSPIRPDKNNFKETSDLKETETKLESADEKPEVDDNDNDEDEKEDEGPEDSNEGADIVITGSLARRSTSSTSAFHKKKK